MKAETPKRHHIQRIAKLRNRHRTKRVRIHRSDRARCNPASRATLRDNGTPCSAQPPDPLDPEKLHASAGGSQLMPVRV